MWEHVNEMSMIVDSSRTLSVACKVGCDEKKTKMDHYMDEFPNELQQFIMNIKDVTLYGNYGYKAIPSFLG